MKDEPQINNCALFAAYAGGNLDTWNAIVGQQVINVKYGHGTIVGIDKKNGEIYIQISFDKETTKTFLGVSLGKYFSGLALPDNLEGIESLKEQLQQQKRIEEQQRKLAEQATRQLEEKRRQEEQQREREATSVRHFAELKSKYLATEYQDSSPSSPLYKILLQLEEGETLDDTDINWLEHKRLFQVIAAFYEKELDKPHSDMWNIVKAGKYWRKAKHPRRVLALTEGLESGDAMLMSAILTNRGAALRDLRELSKARDCASKALEYNSDNFRTYNLLGAICYQSGQPGLGDEYFQKAVELGASPEDQERDIRAALDNSERIQRKGVAQYLLRKDPERYRWAEYYLK